MIIFVKLIENALLRCPLDRTNTDKISENRSSSELKKSRNATNGRSLIGVGRWHGDTAKFLDRLNNCEPNERTLPSRTIEGGPVHVQDRGYALAALSAVGRFGV
jgi:hypothetical protein